MTTVSPSNANAIPGLRRPLCSPSRTMRARNVPGASSRSGHRAQAGRPEVRMDGAPGVHLQRVVAPREPFEVRVTGDHHVGALTAEVLAREHVDRLVFGLHVVHHRDAETLEVEPLRVGDAGVLPAGVVVAAGGEHRRDRFELIEHAREHDVSRVEDQVDALERGGDLVPERADRCRHVGVRQDADPAGVGHVRGPTSNSSPSCAGATSKLARSARPARRGRSRRACRRRARDRDGRGRSGRPARARRTRVPARACCGPSRRGSRTPRRCTARRGSARRRPPRARAPSTIPGRARTGATPSAGS